MKKITLLFLLSFFVLHVYAEKVTDYVNPFIGTGAIENSLSGNNYPGATSPFGMVQLSPDTRQSPDWDVACGYNYNDTNIYGFSHTHLSGTGVAELFDVMLMPVTGDIRELVSTNDYHSSFSHKEESARPGYYQVKLQDSGINAELTTTTRAGFHKYTYPSGAKANVVFDLDHSRDKGSWGTRIILSQIRIVDEYTIEGFRIITGWPNLRKVCFYAKLSKPIRQSVLRNGDTKYFDTPVVNGNKLSAILEFDNKDNAPLLIKLGLSPVSAENAKLNLEKEIRDWNFEKVVAEADREWEKELGKLKVEGTQEQKQIFYTALYHALIQPNTISDVNGEYMTTDFSLGKTDGSIQYSTFSLWDTYRAAHPLYTLIQKDRTVDFVKSLMAHYETYGYLPIWHLWGQENYCMIGNHSIPVIVDAVMKGCRGIDIEKAYEAVKNSSTTNHLNSPFDVWEKYGYMPENIQTQSVSITLEMAFNDWCVAQLANKLGKKDDYDRFMKRSQYYRNLYNKETHFFQSKDDKGNWIEPFDPFRYGANGGYPFTEGNAWQYYWYVPQDVPGLIALTGGDKAFVEKLDEFFTNDHHEELNDNASGFIGQYAHGNEPSHHVAYLYNYAGEPWKTQKYVSQIMTELYNTNSAGYAGNDDCGEMSAWYVFSAMGFYPVNPANGVYVIGSPLLQKAEIELENGKSFTIIAPKKSGKDIYIQSVSLNGKKYDKTYITHSDIINGGILEFKMGASPSKWGVKAENRPN
ncbi:GH92 family glycosyl hydrolase [Dysgonomonas sp. 520]|uniref:GH92 family glycosyl hydrolase n=1 Tax=Dysgonomonas sp. 520 TaxID=2302931 RepID=UPI0013D73193|nr:GH92 family glycosyl hydrolase [Dysgonomonas sp. 520]NDW08584.1 glycoside hydrolase family 92 protein [Dysgonomonas sp. 520]